MRDLEGESESCKSKVDSGWRYYKVVQPRVDLQVYVFPIVW